LSANFVKKSGQMYKIIMNEITKKTIQL